MQAWHGPGSDADRLAGVLVHRLLQRIGLNEAIPAETLAGAVQQAIRHDEQPDITDAATLSTRVIAAYRAIASNPEVQEIYRSGEPIHEVPFVLSTDGRFVRGSIDCLIRSADRVTVLEFKTGQRRVEHQLQAEMYRKAAQAIFPGGSVDARIVYAGEASAAGA